MNFNTDIPNEYDSEDYLDIVRKLLSAAFFRNENQLEWLGTERVGRRKFIALTNIKNKEQWVRNQSPRYGKLKVVEVMFMPTNPWETQKIFWRPARNIVFRRILIKVRNSAERARARVMTTRVGVISQKLAYRLRKGSASAWSACFGIWEPG